MVTSLPCLSLYLMPKDAIDLQMAQIELDNMRNASGAQAVS